MVRVAWQDPVLVITLDRPDVRNAVDVDTLHGLTDAIAAAGDARAVVLTGTPPAFCAGADLQGVEDGEFVALLRSVLRGFTALPAPVIATIDGPAFGAGTQLASVCDLRVATSRSTFAIPAARLGLAVDRWTVDRLVQEFTPPIARAMLVAAETYYADRLFAAGVVHRLGTLDDALEWAAEIATLAPLTLAAHKLGVEGSDDFDAAREHAWRSADAVEGRAAFLEKRPARFEGR